MAESGWSEKGFSLLELMVALAIFVTSIGVLLAAQTAASQNQARARHLYTATMLMRQLLTTAEVEGISDAGEDVSEGDFGESFPEYSWRRTVTDAFLDPEMLDQLAGVDLGAANVQALMPGVRSVKLEVFWGDEESAKSVDMTYYSLTGW